MNNMPAQISNNSGFWEALANGPYLELLLALLVLLSRGQRLLDAINQLIVSLGIDQDELSGFLETYRQKRRRAESDIDDLIAKIEALERNRNEPSN